MKYCLTVLAAILLPGCQANPSDARLVVEPVRMVQTLSTTLCKRRQFLKISNLGSARAHAIVIRPEQVTIAGLPLRILPGLEVGESLVTEVCIPESGARPACLQIKAQSLENSRSVQNAPPSRWCTQVEPVQLGVNHSILLYPLKGGGYAV